MSDKEIKKFIKQVRNESNKDIDVRIRKIMKDNKEETERYVGAIQESFQDKLDFVIEKVIDIDEKVTLIQSDISFVKADLYKKTNYDEYSALERRVSKLEAKQNG